MITKKQILAAVCVLAACSEYANAQNSYKNKPLLLAGNEKADVGIEKNWRTGAWRISPQIANDTLNVKLYSAKESVAFRTDKDSIRFDIKPGETKSFYVKWNDAAPAHTIISAAPFKWDIIAYSKDSKRKDMKIYYEKAPTAYFDSLSRSYPIGQVIKNERTDFEKVLAIMNWTHHQWKHDGNNAPVGSDGLSILNEARAGGRFPCFAYAIVLKDQLIANGYKARVVYIKTRDAATRKNSSPGHVVTEVFLNDLKKWVFADGQFNVIPTLNNKPLNGVEFQQALSKNYDQVVLASKDQVSKREYTDFVYEYLFYFDTTFDARLIPANQKHQTDGKRSLMLVPEGADNLTKVSFWNSTVDYCVYTHSVKDFYALPE